MSEPAPTADRPATFHEVMESREFRAVFFASTLSWFGDYAARAAITALVYQRTSSVAVSAAAFAISYLPWLGIGSVLAAMAERRSYRRIMINCDVARLGLMALVALTTLPVWAMMLLLFLTALLNPPFDAARSALLPRILDGDRYVVGLAIQKTAGQAALVLGYVAGASLVAVDARLALLFNAATFGISALAVTTGVAEHAPVISNEPRAGLMRETADGFAVVFGSPVLRAIAIVVFASSFFTVVPEGLAAGWAADLTSSSSDRGWYQGVIMMANPLGFVIGGLIVGRLVAPSMRLRLIRPFAVLGPLALVPALLSPGVYIIAAMNIVCGFALAGLLPASNGLFVKALPPSYRARAFGVMQSGTQVVQGAAVLVAGALADRFPLHLVVGVWAVGGVIVLLLASLTWPHQERITEAIAASGYDGHADRPPAAPNATPPAAQPAAPEPATGPVGAAGETDGPDRVAGAVDTTGDDLPTGADHAAGTPAGARRA